MSAVPASLIERAARLVTVGHGQIETRLAALVDQVGPFRVAGFLAALEAEGWHGKCAHELTAKARAHRWCDCTHEEADRAS